MRRLETLLVALALVGFLGAGAGLVVSAPATISPTPSAPALPTLAPPRELVEGVVGPVEIVDPLFATTQAERSIAALLYRGLARLGQDGPEPDLAAGWVEDTETGALTVTLRPDAHWHDGRHVTADDVLATLAIITDPSYAGPAQGRWEGITAERLDRFTVRLTTVQPVAGLPAALTQPLVPAHLVAAGPVPVGVAGPRPVGSGPFAFVSASATEVVLRRVGERPGGAPPAFPSGPTASPPERLPDPAGWPPAWFDTYRFRILAPGEALSALRDGEVHVAALEDPAEVRGAVGADGLRVLRYPGTRIVTLVPNLRFAGGSLASAQVRRALSRAIDREALGAAVWGGAASPVQVPVPPASWRADPAIAQPPPADPAAARDGLEAAGWTDGVGGWRPPGADEALSIDLLVPAGDAALVAAAERVATGWTDLGLATAVVELPAQELVEDHLRPGDFEVALLSLDVGTEHDLFPLLASSQAVEGGSNLSGYQSTVLDRALQAARLPGDPATRQARARDLQALLARELPLIAVTVPDVVVATAPELVGPEPNLLGRPEDRYDDVLAWRFASTPDE